MSAVIPTAIPPQSFEIVRDRLSRIITEELSKQFILGGNAALNVTSWIERFVPFASREELPAVNVMLSEGTYGGETVIQADGTYRYYVDAYVHAKSDEVNGGDTKAIVKLHRLLGVIRAIIMDTRYKTLGFGTPNGFIMNRRIESLQISNPNAKEHDAMSSVMGRLVVTVKVPETVSYVPVGPLTRMVTTVKLASTDLGYQWVTTQAFNYDVFDFSYDYTYHFYN